MTSNSSENLQGIDKQLNTLVNALAEKGTPGIIFLAIIFIPIWAPVSYIFYLVFKFLGPAKDLSALSSTGGIILATIIVGILCVIYISIACYLTKKIIGAIVPTIKAEAEASLLMSNALGGQVATSTDTWEFRNIGGKSAEDRTKRIMKVLLEHAQDVLQVELVRSNIFTLCEDGRLKILNGFHLNMEGCMVAEHELSISIPNGFLSSGWAYKYFRPVLSMKKNGEWPHTEDSTELQQEVAKAHPDLQWILSMPIPYRVRPFKLVCGVLNIDGLGTVPLKEQIMMLLADLSTTVDLISVLNRGTGFLEGIYSRPSEPDPGEQEQLKDLLVGIDPVEFDPATCPEPSKEFVLALSRIQGLEFFAKLSPTEVTSFLKKQLCS